MISFNEFKKVEITVGKILSAEKVPETDKLLKLSVDFGGNTNCEQSTKVRTEHTTTLPSAPLLRKEGIHARDVRQIISGIAEHFPEPQTLVGKKCMFVTNIEPRVIRGLESNGMILAVSTEGGKFSLLEPSGGIPEGTRAK